MKSAVVRPSRRIAAPAFRLTENAWVSDPQAHLAMVSCGGAAIHIRKADMGSWSITVNDLDEIESLPGEIYDKACGDDAELQGDALAAFVSAKDRGLVSATISGGRTPSPYGGPDTVVITVVGFNNRNEGHAVAPMAGRDFNSTMVSTILTGPDNESEPEIDEQYRGSPYQSNPTGRYEIHER